MADVGLRKLLAEAVAADCGCSEWKQHTDEGRAALARLSQPDVLDEFERRVGLATLSHDGGMNGTVALARRVLADMLGGES